MLKQLTTENAVIQTATVEIKTLTLSGKQVTLAVFRQLPEEDLIEIDLVRGKSVFSLTGKPWGIVRYCLKGCPSTSHLHVVWQSEDTLYRSTILPSIWSDKDIFDLAIEKGILYRNFTWLDFDMDGTHCHTRLNRSMQKKWDAFKDLKESQNKEYRKIYLELAELPQLFIAV